MTPLIGEETMQFSGDRDIKGGKQNQKVTMVDVW